SEASAEASIEVELKLIKSLPKTMKVRETNRQLALQVKVKDNGKGIAESDLPHIFDRFYRADPARSNQREINTPTGAGLGLAIAKAIVENHYGQITVTSNLQQGTTFIVTLPQITFQPD
ncbi:MAG: sensor histidine kinase, partial [Waterburya sp.]